MAEYFLWSNLSILPFSFPYHDITLPIMATAEVERPQLDSNHGYASNVKDAILQEEKLEASSVAKLSKEHDIALKSIRILIADLCAKHKGGHPG